MKRPRSKHPTPLTVLGLTLRLREMELTECNLNCIPNSALWQVAKGELLLVVKRGPGICKHCGRPVALTILTHTTEKPLAELFHP